MTTRFLTKEQVFDSSVPPYATGERRLSAMAMHIPYPLQFLVTTDPGTGKPRVTATTLAPLSWRPYTMSACVPLTDSATIRNLQAEGDCVMAMPMRSQAYEAWIMSHPFPAGISAAEVAGLTLAPSHRVLTPSIQECALNFECLIEYYLEYHGYGFVSLRVLGATLDEEILALSREEVTNRRYPVNYVGEAVHDDGTVSAQLAMMGDIESCPTFPVGHKAGWDTRMRSWLRDLAEEEYLSSTEEKLVLGWVECYEALRLDPSLPKRQALQKAITTFAEHAAWQEWDKVHEYLQSHQEDSGE